MCPFPGISAWQGASADRHSSLLGKAQPPTKGSTTMRKLIIPMLTACALAVPAATAAPMKGKPGGTKPCHGKAKVMVVLKGTLANDPVAGETSFQLTVLHTNRWGRGYKQATQPATINVADSTRYVKSGQPSTLDALAGGVEDDLAGDALVTVRNARELALEAPDRTHASCPLGCPRDDLEGVVGRERKRIRLAAELRADARAQSRRTSLCLGVQAKRGIRIAVPGSEGRRSRVLDEPGRERDAVA